MLAEMPPFSGTSTTRMRASDDAYRATMVARSGRVVASAMTSSHSP